MKKGSNMNEEIERCDYCRVPIKSKDNDPNKVVKTCGLVFCDEQCFEEYLAQGI